MNESGTEQTIEFNLSGAGSTYFYAQGNTSNTHLTGDLSGFGTLTLSRQTNDGSTGKWTLSGNNSYGITGISVAIVYVENANALGTGNVIINSSSARLINTSGSAMTLSNTLELRNGYVFAGEDDITFTDGVYLHGDGTDHQVDAATSDTLTLNGDFSYRSDGSDRKDDPFIKAGIGTVVWNMTPVNDTPWVGGFNVNNGTLIVNSDVSSNTGATTVAAGAVLGGSGTLGGAATISGSLRPGNSIGTLTVDDDVTWNGSAGNEWVFELGAGSAADLLDITEGAFVKGTGDDFIIDLAGASQAGTFTLVQWTNTADLGGGALGTNFAISDFTFTNLAEGYEVSDVAFSGESLQLTVIPEPHTLGLLLAAGGLLALRRRRGTEKHVDR